MAPDALTLVETLRPLAEKITKGEWFQTRQPSRHDCYAEESGLGARLEGVYEEHYIGKAYSQADAEFIVALVNAWPELADALAARETLTRERVRVLLTEFAGVSVDLSGQRMRRFNTREIVDLLADLFPDDGRRT